jgi:EmrB/QacA subfamily drug resistance transporter
MRAGRPDIRRDGDRTRPSPSSPRHIEYKWIVLSVTTLGAAMAAIDSSIVILALPQMLFSLHSDLLTMVWVIMGYILMSTVTLALFGRLADMFGRVRLYNLGFVVFTAGSVLCAISQTGLELVFLRLLQGLGGAMLLSNSAAIITEVFPPEQRGRALGINGITWAIGGILGPVLGGLILAAASWRWIFLINLPIGVFGTAWAHLALHEVSTPARTERFDVAGMGLFSSSLICLLVALTQGVSWGWMSERVLALFAGAVVFAAAFVAWNRRSTSPFLDFSLFGSKVFTYGTFAAILQSLGLFAVSFLVVFYLQAARGDSPLHAALLILPLPIVQSVVGPIGGTIADRTGARLPAAIGLALQALGATFLATLSTHSSYLHLDAALVILGIGGGLFWSPNTSAVMSAAPRHRLGVGSATLASFRQVGMVTSFALTLAVAAATMPPRAIGSLFLGSNEFLTPAVAADFTHGISVALSVSVVIVLVAFVLILVGGEPREARRGTALSAAER